MRSAGVVRARTTLFALTLLSSTVAVTLGADGGSWPYWRGPAANGMAVGDAPLKWSDTENVRWKTAIPGKGNSSPVIWGDKIFLTTAIPTGVSAKTDAAAAPPAQEGRRGRSFGDTGPQLEQRFDVLCLDRNTGKVLWQKTTKVATPHEGYHGTYGSFASNSPVTDGKRVYAFFGSRGIYAYDLDGNLLWAKDFGPMRIKMAFGEGTAPVLHADRLILNFDHEGGSFLVMLDAATGKEIWKVDRDEITSWAAPLVVEYKGKQEIITAATKKVRSYDFATGNLVWECTGLGSNVIPQPVIQDDLVLVMSGHRDPKLMAIRLGREGDLTGTDAIVWSQTRGNSYTPSPVLHDNKLYVLTDNGFVSCYNASTGAPYYQQTRLPKAYNFKSSPVGANGKLYLASENDDVIVLGMGETFEVLATNTIPDSVFIATPAIAEGEIFLRSQSHLYCISEK